jgi:DNA (cytosine-5)-methyltransferase 3A
MSCGRIALDEIGLKPHMYYASEVDKNSIKTSQKNYPDIIQLGDITELTNDELLELGETDLLMGGSPCQNLSIAVINDNEHNQGLEGEESSLFFEYERVLKAVKPKYFLFENVASMKDVDRDIITSCLGIEPIIIDSNLLTAQDRKRYYWTNIPNVTQPVDKGVILSDILECVVDEKYFYKQSFDYHGEDKKIEATLHVNSHEMLKRIYNKNGKVGTLTACRGGYKQKKILDGGRARKLTPLEYERLQGVPEGYTGGVADGHRYNMLGDGWTVPVIAHILSFMDKKTLRPIE